MIKWLCEWLLITFTFCWAVWSIRRGIHNGNVVRIIAGCFVLMIFAYVGYVLAFYPDFKPPNGSNTED